MTNSTHFQGVLSLSECGSSIHTQDRLKALAYSRLTASSLSLIGSISILVYVLKKHKLASSEIHPLFILGIADFLLAAILIVGNAMFLHDINQPCNVMAWVTWITELVTHLLTVMYALVTWLKMYELTMAPTSSREKRADFNTKRFVLQKVLYVVCWILPVGLGLPRFQEGLKNEHGCLRCLSLWAQDSPDSGNDDKTETGALSDYASTVFIVVLCMCSVALVLLYGHVRVMIKRMIRGRGVFGNAERQQEKRMQRRALLYICVFFVCWLPTLVVTIWARSVGRRLDVARTDEFCILMLQAWTLTMQGFLNCLVYGWSRVDFRKPKNYQTLPFRQDPAGINAYGATASSTMSSAL